MKRAAVIAVAATAALIVGLGVGQLWLARGGGETVALPSELVAVTTSLRPTVHAFGDPVEARADVLVDTREIDLESIRLQPEFGPYEALEPPMVTREQFGDVGRARYVYRLVCLKEGCDAAGARGVSDFPSGRLRYEFRDRRGNAFEAFDWPLLEVASRVAEADTEQIRWRSDATTLVPASYRVGALGAAAVLLVVALGCVGAATVIARRLWWPTGASDGDSSEETVSMTPLELAFDVALLADGPDPPDRRRALERVARELESTGRDDLVLEARSLAWAPAPSSVEQVGALAVRAGVLPAAGERT